MAKRRGNTGAKRLSGTASPTHPKRIAATQRHAEWVALRLQHRSLSDIAAQYGVSKSTVSEAIRIAMGRHGAEDAAELRAIENERLEHFARVAADICEDENLDEELRLKALDRLVRISKRRSEINGSDAAPQAAVGPDGKPVVPSITVIYEGPSPAEDPVS